MWPVFVSLGNDVVIKDLCALYSIQLTVISFSNEKNTNDTFNEKDEHWNSEYVTDENFQDLRKKWRVGKTFSFE